MAAKLRLFSVKKCENKLSDQELKIYELIKRRRLQILVHSCIYYELNQNIISDATFNSWSKQLVDLQNKYPEISKKVKFYEDFKDFDGSTGFNLPYDDIDVISRATSLLKYKEKTNE